MTESNVIQFNHCDYDINLFDIDIKSVEPQSFVDSKTGQTQTYFTGKLLYNGKEPFMLIKGPSYGVQKSDKKKGDDDAPAPVQGMVQLPSAPAKAGPEETRKDKWQIGIKLSEKAPQKEWSPSETTLVNFFDRDLRVIIARVLSKKVEILTKIGSNAIADTQQKFASEMQDPSNAGKYDTQEAQLARFTTILADTLMGKISRKVYRKKKEQKEGAPINLMDMSSQYDETKWPTLYASMQNWISKKTKEEEFGTDYYKFVEGALEADWPKLTHAEAVALGWYEVQAAVKFSDMYFAASIAPQLKCLEIAFMKAIESGGSRHGRLIKAPDSVPRNPRLIQRSAIQPAGAKTEEKGKEEAGAAPAPFVLPQATAPMAFNPATLNNIPGIAALQIPVISNSNN